MPEHAAYTGTPEHSDHLRLETEKEFKIQQAAAVKRRKPLLYGTGNLGRESPLFRDTAGVDSTYQPDCADRDHTSVPLSSRRILLYGERETKGEGANAFSFSVPVSLKRAPLSTTLQTPVRTCLPSRYQ